MSGKTSGLGDNFYVGGYDLSGDVNALSKISSPYDVLDFTTVNKSAYVRQTSLRQGEIDFTTFMDFPAAVTSPGVPLTTVPYVSTYNDPVLVTVIGGTGTNVSINGVLQGTFDGTYVLPPLGTIILTYSAAPTWSWTKIGAAHDVLSALPRTDTIVTYARGTAVGSPAACLNSKLVNYDGTRGTDASLTLTVQAIGDSYGLEWGEQLTAGLRTDLAATTGAFRDDGASSAFGAQAYLQLVGFIGTSVDVTVKHATTSGGSYSTLIDFGALTAIGAVRASVSNATTVNEFLKVVTAGTFTYAKFSVVFCRNPAAGLVF
jgi:hypothetical protein